VINEAGIASQMNEERNQRLREPVYGIGEAQGCPDGPDEEHRQEAEREVRGEETLALQLVPLKYNQAS
jgi:hypothetical protein